MHSASNYQSTMAKSANPTTPGLRMACSQWRALRSVLPLMFLCIPLCGFAQPSADLWDINEQKSMFCHYKGANTFLLKILSISSSFFLFLQQVFILVLSFDLPVLACLRGSKHRRTLLFTMLSVYTTNTVF